MAGFPSGRGQLLRGTITLHPDSLHLASAEGHGAPQDEGFGTLSLAAATRETTRSPPTSSVGERKILAD